MPMRWRWPPENSCGYFRHGVGGNPAPFQHLLGDVQRLAPVGRQLVLQDALRHDIAHRLARVERRIRVLEDDLHLAAHLLHLGAVQRHVVLDVEHRRTVELHAAARGLLQAESWSCRWWTLPQPDSAHEPENLALLDVEGNAVNRLDISADAGKDALADRKIPLEAPDLDKRFRGNRIVPVLFHQPIPSFCCA